MKSRILLALEDRGQTMLEEYLRARGHEVVVLGRKDSIQDNQLSLDDRAIWLGPRDLLSTIDVAIIFDSGYPWPIPSIRPTAEEWTVQRERFDDYLRAERERASLWYSALGLLNLSMPCMNPQTAFAHEATKPSALEWLASSGLDVAPFLATNERGELEDFGAAEGALVSLDQLGSRRPTPLTTSEVSALPLDREPALVCALDRMELIRLVAVQGAAVHVDPPIPDPSGIEALVHEAAQLLEAPAVELFLGWSQSKLSIVDFRVSVPLSSLETTEATAVMNAMEQWALTAKGHA
jgi:hypothetical protein